MNLTTRENRKSTKLFELKQFGRSISTKLFELKQFGRFPIFTQFCLLYFRCGFRVVSMSFVCSLCYIYVATCSNCGGVVMYCVCVCVFSRVTLIYVFCIILEQPFH